jgi:serine/threonine-protein kinase
VAAAVVLGGVSLRGPAKTPVPGVGAVTAAAATASGEASAVVELRLMAAPPVARLFLDDEPLGESPFKGRFPRDGAVHRLRVEAPGFVTMHDTVIFDKDRFLDLRLARQSEPETNPASSAAPLSPAQPAASAGHFNWVPSRWEKRRRLDQKNPYGPDRR